MLQTIVGNVVIGGLIILSLLSLVLPMWVELQRKIPALAIIGVRKFLVIGIGITVALFLLISFPI